MKNKVLLVSPFYPPNIGGAESFAEDLAKALSKKYTVHICTIKWKKPVLWQGLSLIPAIKIISKLTFHVLKLTKKYHYEKIYALGLISSLICCLFNIKFYTIMLALYDFKKKNLVTKFILNKAIKIFVEGERGKKDILNLGIDENKIIKFQHWCDQSRFYYTERKNNPIKVLFVGRPIKIKGKHIIEQCERFTKGIEYKYVENIPYTDLPKHYQMADIVVVPSLYSEGFSKVVIEAASCGCVLVTSNKGALPELVSPFGKCLDPNPVSFALELTKLNSNLSAIYKLQMNTALYALNNFNERNAKVFYEKV